MASKTAGRSGPAQTAESDSELSTVDGLTQLSFLILGTLERRAGEHGVSIIQTRLLGVLRDRTPTMNKLAQLLNLDKSSITGLVDRAERRGLVARVACTADRRSVEVGLTDAGRSLVAQVAAGFEADIESLLDCLPRSNRDALSKLVREVLVAHARSRGFDLSTP